MSAPGAGVVPSAGALVMFSGWRALGAVVLDTTPAVFWAEAGEAVVAAAVV